MGVLGIIGGLAAINVRGGEMGTRVSNFFTFAKLLPLIGLIMLGIIFRGHAMFPMPATVPAGWQKWIEVLIAMVFAYSGFESAMIPGSELKNPRRDAPVAAFSALLMISVLYVCLHLVVMRAVPDMASTERPLSDAAAVYIGEPGRVVVVLAAIASTFGWLSAAVVTAPRLTLGMADKGDLPAVCGMVHPKFPHAVGFGLVVGGTCDYLGGSREFLLERRAFRGGEVSRVFDDVCGGNQASQRLSQTRCLESARRFPDSSSRDRDLRLAGNNTASGTSDIDVDGRIARPNLLGFQPETHANASGSKIDFVKENLAT